MLIVYLMFSSLYLHGCCGNILLFREPRNDRLITCVTKILRQYFSEHKGLTYVDINSDDGDLLKAIHSMTAISLVSLTNTSLQHEGYFVTSTKISDFTEHFPRLARERMWNPSARFLIIIKLLREENLIEAFNLLLKLHVINVLIVNWTEDAHLYTYNPFDNYACGRYYDAIISYGLCSQTTNNLYPNKLVNGLRNCTFTTIVPHRPPFAMDPSKWFDKGRKQLGVEQYLFKLIAEKEQFEVKFDYNYGYESYYSTITSDMQATGPLKKIQDNETEAMLGNLLLVSSRIEAFSYLHGHLDYIDELNFVVKRACFVAGWKYFNLEFSPIVWCLLLFVFVIYCTLLIVLLQSKDKTKIILTSFNILLPRTYKVHCQFRVKCIFIMWAWFTYLINNYYTSSLFSFTMHPLSDYQISTEDDIIDYKLKPCVSGNIEAYFSTETNKFSHIQQACSGSEDNVLMVSKSKDLYSIIQKSFFIYDIKQYSDEYGELTIYMLKKRYGIYLMATFFYKGFPITEKMRITSIRLRDTGIADKILGDIYTAKLKKLHFLNKEFKMRSSLPWFVYFAGCILSILVFIFETSSCPRIRPHGL